MKILVPILKIAVICWLIYKSLFNAFLFLIAGMWIIPVLLLTLFVYLCKSLVTESITLNNRYKSFKHFDCREKLSRFKIPAKISKRFSSETV